jgi:hypothetical protein
MCLMYLPAEAMRTGLVCRPCMTWLQGADCVHRVVLVLLVFLYSLAHLNVGSVCHFRSVATSAHQQLHSCSCCLQVPLSTQSAGKAILISPRIVFSCCCLVPAAWFQLQLAAGVAGVSSCCSVTLTRVIYELRRVYCDICSHVCAVAGSPGSVALHVLRPNAACAAKST